MHKYNTNVVISLTMDDAMLMCAKEAEKLSECRGRGWEQLEEQNFVIVAEAAHTAAI